MYLLCYFYEKVNIYKPLTSREANSEKYIICTKFKKKLNYNKIIDKLTKNFYDLENKNWDTYSSKFKNRCDIDEECKDFCGIFKEYSDGSLLRYCVESIDENHYAIKLPIGAQCEPKEDYTEEVQCGNTSSTDNSSQYNFYLWELII